MWGPHRPPALRSADLPQVTERPMFGSDGFGANGTIYALVWDGRVVLRLPDDARCAKAAPSRQRADGRGAIGREVVMRRPTWSRRCGGGSKRRTARRCASPTKKKPGRARP